MVTSNCIFSCIYTGTHSIANLHSTCTLYKPVVFQVSYQHIWQINNCIAIDLSQQTGNYSNNDCDCKFDQLYSDMSDINTNYIIYYIYIGYALYIKIYTGIYII